jgi:hypothetical protein
MNTARLLAAALLCSPLALAGPAAAEDAAPKVEVQRETLGIPGAKRAAPSRADMIEQTRRVTRGYYEALKQAKYDEAAGFLHPATLEPLRDALLKQVEAAPPNEKKAMLKALGAADESRLRTMPLHELYVAWAKSPYCKGVQVLAQMDLSVVLGTPTCKVEDRICQVQVTLKGLDEQGQIKKAPSDVWVLEDQGRWLLTVNPPTAG